MSTHYLFLSPLSSPGWKTLWWELPCSCRGVPTDCVGRRWAVSMCTCSGDPCCLNPGCPTWGGPRPSGGLAARWPHWETSTRMASTVRTLEKLGSCSLMNTVAKHFAMEKLKLGFDIGQVQVVPFLSFLHLMPKGRTKEYVIHFNRSEHN